MVIKFNDKYLECLIKDEKIKGKPKFSSEVILKLKKTLKILQRMPDTKSLRTLNSLNFEALKGNRYGFFSVRVDYRYRLIFSIEQDLIVISEIIIIEEITNHYQ